MADERPRQASASPAVLTVLMAFARDVENAFNIASPASTTAAPRSPSCSRRLTATLRASASCGSSPRDHGVGGTSLIGSTPLPPVYA